jgi:hypothetical protein
MRPLTAEQLFELWERGLGQPAALRAQALLSASEPETAWDELGARSVSRRDADLLRLRAATFGSELHSRVACAACGEALEFALDACALLPEGGTERRDPGAAGRLAVAGFDIAFRPPSAADLVELARRTPGDMAAARALLLSRCVLAATRAGEAMDVAELPFEAQRALDQAMAEADPGAELRLALECPVCGASSEALFDVPAFFWAEIEAWVERTARDVHALASAYGWREADVLAMSPARRRLYLSQVTP